MTTQEQIDALKKMLESDRATLRTCVYVKDIATEKTVEIVSDDRQVKVR